MPPLRPSRLITLGVIVLLGCPACSPRKTNRTNACAPAVKRTQQYLGALCKAWRQAPRSKNRSRLRAKHRRLDQWRLAQADLPLVKTLPDAPLAALGPGWLVLDNNVVSLWSSHWRRRGSAKPAAWAPVQKTGAGDRLVRKLRKHQGSNDRAELLLAIAPTTPSNQVVVFLDLVQRAGYKRVDLLLTPRNPPRVPHGLPGDPVKARLTPKRGRPWTPPNIIAVERVEKPWRAKRCADVVQLLDSLQRAGRTNDCDRLVADVQQAITRCRCAVDERPLLELARRWIGPLVFIAVHRVTLSPEAPPMKVTDGALPWSKLLGRVLKMDPRAFRLTGFTLEPASP